MFTHKKTTTQTMIHMTQAENPLPITKSKQTANYLNSE